MHAQVTPDILAARVVAVLASGPAALRGAIGHEVAIPSVELRAIQVAIQRGDASDQGDPPSAAASVARATQAVLWAGALLAS